MARLPVSDCYHFMLMFELNKLSLKVEEILETERFESSQARSLGVMAHQPGNFRIAIHLCGASNLSSTERGLSSDELSSH